MKNSQAMGSAHTRKGIVIPFTPDTRLPKDDRPLAEREAEPRTCGGARGRASLAGGDYRIRTDDPLLAKQVLYQLS